ncbi:MAG: hypothetical protein ABJP45_11320 [Cyclobacteriaceae bacterium]
MSKAFLFSLLFTTACIVSAQNIDLSIPAPPKKDYIQLLDGTVLTGEVQYDSVQNIIYYKATDEYYEVGNGKFELIENSTVAEFKNEKIKYVRQFWRGEERFVVELVQGDVSLYNIYDDYFIRFQGENIELSEENFKESLSSIYGQRCDWLFNSSFLVYSKIFMVHLVNGYNKVDCFKVQRKQFGLRINVRNTHNNIFISTEQIDTDLDRAAGLSIGLQAEIPTYKRSTIFVALDFMSQTFDEDFTILSFTKINVKTFHFILQAGPKLYFNNLFVELGPTIAYSANRESFVTRGVGLNSSVTESLNLNGVGLGIHYAAGYTISNSTKSTMSVELRNTRFQGADLSVRVATLGFYVGF